LLLRPARLRDRDGHRRGRERLPNTVKGGWEMGR
jgi:hypothetical protein